MTYQYLSRINFIDLEEAVLYDFMLISCRMYFYSGYMHQKKWLAVYLFQGGLVRVQFITNWQQYIPGV